MKNTSPILNDHLSQIYTSEQTLHGLIPEALKQIQDEQITSAFGDLLSFTMQSGRRMGQVTSLLDANLRPIKPQVNQALVEELENHFGKSKTAAEQTQLLELLHKYLGNLFTDYTYTINLVDDKNSQTKDAIDLLQESIDELKQCNDELSRLALKKISAVKKDQDRILEQAETAVAVDQPVFRPRVGLRGGVSERTAEEQKYSIKREMPETKNSSSFGSRLRSAWAVLTGK